jgi:hypothetical protein
VATNTDNQQLTNDNGELTTKNKQQPATVTNDNLQSTLDNPHMATNNKKPLPTEKKPMNSKQPTNGIKHKKIKQTSFESKYCLLGKHPIICLRTEAIKV